MIRVEIITIGDEILQGQIVDTNSAWMATQLLEKHIQVVQITSIADERNAIVVALDYASARADVILVTGGLGPTKDDVTKQTISRYFDSPLVRNEDVLSHVKSIFKRSNREMPPSNKTQADVLQGCEVLFNEYGTAPGMLMRKDGNIYAFLPGVPFEMKYLFGKYLLPQFDQLTSSQHEFVVNEYILTVGIGESHLAEQIEDIENSLPDNIHLAFLPKIGIVRLRLTGVGRDEEGLRNQVIHFRDLIVSRIGHFVAALADISIEEVIIKKMKDKGYTLSTAESCTGGNIASKIVEVSGASSIFSGGIVSYSNQVKIDTLSVSENDLIKFGAVSEEVATQMAVGALSLMNTDFAVATTGIAGPDGGTEDKPVGTVWIAIAAKDRVRTKKFHFRNDRVVNIERTTSNALIMLWNALNSED